MWFLPEYSISILDASGRFPLIGQLVAAATLFSRLSGSYYDYRIASMTRLDEDNLDEGWFRVRGRFRRKGEESER